MLFLLKVIDGGGYDEYDEKLVRASGPQEARMIANEEVGFEEKIWEDNEKVSCEAIGINGEAKVIIDSFNAG